MSTRTDNKELIRRLINEIVNDENYDLADEYFAADYVRHDDPLVEESERGPQAFLKTVKGPREAFPDARIEIKEILAEDDLVAFTGTFSGTHEGPFMGVEPTGKEFAIAGTAMHRIKDGKIAETWATWNMLSLLKQLGADPEQLAA